MIRSVLVFSLEIILASLLVYPYFADNEGAERIFLVLSAYIILHALYTVMLINIREKAKFLFFITILPCAMFVSWLGELTPILGIAIGLFIFWRGTALLDPPLEDHETKLLSLTLIASVPAVIFSTFKGQEILLASLILVGLQFLLALIGRFIISLKSVNGDVRQKYGYIVFFLKMAGILLGTGFLLAVSLDRIQAFFFYIMALVARLLGIIAAPYLKWAEEKRFKVVSDDSDYISGTAAGDNRSDFGETGGNLALTEIGLMILVLAAIGVGFYYLLKKRLVISASDERFIMAVVDGEKTIANPSVKRKMSPPANEIRREFFILERYARKAGFARQPSESLEEWLNRLNAPINSRIIAIYDRVRYGNEQFTPLDLEDSKSEIKRIKDYIKAKRKQWKRMDKDHVQE
ncbi:hypothetical protein A8F94_12125 [Bacillus sp. FJAT-27225]|uniref:DUF4129 domain-containing protein n=1 Tax=Bacillus sp. FJAT-27225 TaxID=1743144 RepID=UPI00080C2B29|nr:DUF4129 domain-containing protein [Bacillus sp. FJAT-27225]OCA85621.1 hypothetical protein A8F94_12125 [Bacillus sp. FJAT-27225]